MRKEKEIKIEMIFYTILCSSRSDETSSAFSSPLPHFNKRPKLVTLKTDQTQSVSLEVNLDEIYRNSRKCPEIEKNLRLRKWRMASFRATLKVAEEIFKNWENESIRARNQQFSNYVVGFVMRIGPSVATLLHALIYTIKLREIYPNARGEQGCAHRLFVVSLLVASKYLNDRQLLIKPNHTTWSSLSGVFTPIELCRMETEFITFIRGKLFVGQVEMERCVEELFFDNSDEMEMSMVVPGSIDWLELISVKSKEIDKRTLESLVP